LLFSVWAKQTASAAVPTPGSSSHAFTPQAARFSVAFSNIHDRLPIQRQVIAAFGYRNGNLQAGISLFTRDRPFRRRRLRYMVAERAHMLRMDVTYYLEARGDVFKLLGHVFAKPLHDGAAHGARISVGRQMELNVSRLMRR